MKKILIILLGLGLLFTANFVYANKADDCTEYCANPEELEMPDGQVCFCNPLKGEGLDAITTPIINFIFNISLFVVPLLVVVGAFMITTAAGDENKMKSGKKMIIWTLIGFILILLSRGLSDLLEAVLGI